MTYPIIRKIEDVLPHIEGEDEFLQIDKGSYKVIDYKYTNPDTFGKIGTLTSDIRRECRGIIFDSDGNLIRRPFHKFFNLNEKPSEKLNTDLNHKVLHKYDGSMIAPFRVDGHVRLGTMLGITDISNQAEEFMADNKRFWEFVEICTLSGNTPIFEWCSRMNRVVLDYEEPKLVLLAIRKNTSGKYVNFKEVQSIAQSWDLECAIEQEAWSVDQKDTEGVVLLFDSGKMLKVKTDWYVELHKVVSQIDKDHKVAQLILDNKMDDIIAKLEGFHMERINKYSDEFYKLFHNKVEKLEEIVGEAKRLYGDDRKQIALNFVPKYPKPYAQFIFKSIQGCDINLELNNFMRKNVGNTKRYQNLWEWMNE